MPAEPWKERNKKDDLGELPDYTLGRLLDVATDPWVGPPVWKENLRKKVENEIAKRGASVRFLDGRHRVDS